MRRADREIIDPAVLEGILADARILFLALHDQPAPYVLPVCYGYQEGTIYVHSVPAGTKIDLVLRDPMVGFSASTEMVVVPGKTACDFSCRARSVVGTGRAAIIADEEERRRGLELIMRHYAPGAPGDAWTWRPDSLSRTCVIGIRILSLRGKQTG